MFLDNVQLHFANLMKKEKDTIEQSSGGCCIVGTNQFFTVNMQVKQKPAEYQILSQASTHISTLHINDI